jgi:energy-coupling factor transporter ATP-binding protein EcfA2
VIRLERATTAVPSPHADAAPRVVLRDLDLAFGPGEIHRILGANGSGKSTLLRTLAGLRAPASGRLRIDGKEISRTGCSEGDRATLWPRVAILFEEPDPQFLTESVEAEIAFGLESLALPPAEIRERTRDALHANGLAGFRRRDPLTLSGGEKARVLLAAVLAARPGALLLDQALAHLDRGTRREIEDELAREAATRGLLVVHARQDLDPLRPGERAHEIRDERLVTLDAAFDPAAAGAGWTRSEPRARLLRGPPCSRWTRSRGALRARPRTSCARRRSKPARARPWP